MPSVRSAARGVAIMLALALAVPVAAVAQDDADRPSIEIARSHMETGQAYYLQGRFGEAAAEFEAAYQAEPFGAFLYNAAVACENAGDPVRALELFQRYLERDPVASDRDAVEQRMDRLRAAIESARAAMAASAAAGGTTGGASTGGATTGAAGTGGTGGTSGDPSAGSGAPLPLGPSAPAPSALPEDFKSLVSVRTEPEGATVIVTTEGREVARGYSPFSYTLDQGRYHVRIEHPDYNVAEQDVSIDPGKVYVVVVNLSQGEFFGYLRVVTDPPGAQVFVDDRSAGPRGQTPFEGPLTVGVHRLWIERAGYAPVEQEAEIAIGADIDLRLELERVTFGRLRVIANVRGARVLIDGALAGVVPFQGDVPAGPHELRVESGGMKTFARSIEIRRGQLTPVRVRLRPDVDRAGGWVAGTFALIFGAGGAACAVISDELRMIVQRERDAGRLATSDERIDHGFFLSIAADAAWGIAGVLAALSIYYFAYDPLPPSDGAELEPRDWALAPFVDPATGTVGGTVGGSF
jgi:hypothetical protein